MTTCLSHTLLCLTSTHDWPPLHRLPTGMMHSAYGNWSPFALTDGFFGVAPHTVNRMMVAPLLRMCSLLLFGVTQAMFMIPKSPWYYGAI